MLAELEFADTAPVRELVRRYIELNLRGDPLMAEKHSELADALDQLHSKVGSEVYCVSGQDIVASINDFLAAVIERHREPNQRS